MLQMNAYSVGIIDVFSEGVAEQVKFISKRHHGPILEAKGREERLPSADVCDVLDGKDVHLLEIGGCASCSFVLVRIALEIFLLLLLFLLHLLLFFFLGFFLQCSFLCSFFLLFAFRRGSSGGGRCCGGGGGGSAKNSGEGGEGELGDVSFEVVDGVAKLNGNSSYRAEVSLPRPHARHGGKPGFISIRGPSRPSKQLATSDGEQLVEAVKSGGMPAARTLQRKLNTMAIEDNRR
mmetsp:Transcript_8628/g.19176  ORF Transcript_8628/g.19176 Transcript_8628/m.19176 type:complete len:235 (-) Transcript_8628:414-1118(-)